MQKDNLRQQLIGRLRLNHKTADCCSAMLVELLQSKDGACKVLSYKAIAAWGEIDLSSLPTLLPHMQFDFVESTKGAPFTKKKYDVIIVPLLGFNKDGYRLGHGGGWYDRFLATQPQALKVGVGYENTLVDFTPEPHDVRMDDIVTEVHPL